MDVGIPADSPNLVLLFFVTQLFLRELSKSKNLIRIVPMDMSGYFESRAGPSNIGNVISQILLCKQITPDFNEEELCSIKKDSEEIGALIAELQEFMPQSEADTATDRDNPPTVAVASSFSVVPPERITFEICRMGCSSKGLPPEELSKKKKKKKM
uniref:Uncharacterized protein n=1 Tax=Vespula pensylvanica TaxID=30213 RepID=A0A834K8W5_VESPE|nr:hypothetical protein H0235_015376 [Vespula pensylvanica]